ncbi:hypothetical protein FQN55_000646 [Onygenales sp. PD_40]|nr:hypothetical protein FQN55_000646 [Onygenales sp. PD_40]KAK2785375.1 hypothetical protein FQN51_003817 [Onygenales sp. PD_10]
MASQTLTDEVKRYGRAATHDFRSDTVTLTTPAMLSSIITQCPYFGDDIFTEDAPTTSLESYVAELTGLPHALFISSGTMGNQLALRSLLKQPPHSVVLDRHSHTFEHESGMASMFSQAQLIPISKNLSAGPAYLTLTDIAANIVPDDGDTHSAPTRIIALENTHNGKIMPVSEVQRISEFARKHGIKLHMDGARLWNACYPPSTTTTTSPAEEASATALSLLRAYCSLVDTVTLCFSKSLGAPAGSILLSNSAETIARARHFRKAMGGGMRQVGVLSAAARVAVEEVFVAGAPMVRANRIAREVEGSWVGMGGKVVEGLGQETNMVWLDLGAAGVEGGEFVGLCGEEGVKVTEWGRVVVHYQISDEAVEALKRALKRAIELGKTRGGLGAEGEVKKNGLYSYSSGTK